MSEKEKIDKAVKRRKFLIDELLFPALSAAFHCDPGKFQDHILEVELSKTDIELAYGRDGLAEWNSFFSLKKIGGIDRFGNGYKSRWVLNINKYALVIKLVQELGHTLKDLPKVCFPPEAMRERLRVIHERRTAKRARRAVSLQGKVSLALP